MSSKPSIFVSIACLSDHDVVPTVQDMLAKAEHAERIMIGICLQIDPEDTRYDALKSMPRVRLDIMHYAEAMGPIYARARCEQLMVDEDYYFQIDCHSRFFPKWDSFLIDELTRCQALSPQAAISHYPINIKNMENPEYLRSIGHVNRFRHVDTDAIKSHGSLIRMPEQPLLSIGISAAMLFLPASLKRQIPFDPDLHFGLHAAEQVLYATRLWTHGVDLYAPTAHCIATDYAGSRDRIPEAIRRACSGSRKRWPDKTWSKVKYLLELDTLEQVAEEYRADLDVEHYPYGMGQARSLLDYYRYCGLHEQLIPLFPHYRYKND